MAQDTRSDSTAGSVAAAPGGAIEINEQELTQRKAFSETVGHGGDVDHDLRRRRPSTGSG